MYFCTLRKLGLGPVLIVCPATVLHQWVSEFHLWWPSFRVAVLHDSGSFSGTRKQLVSSIATASGVLVTTFASIRIHNQLLLQQQWDYVVLDEGHKIRNPDSEITISCKQVRHNALLFIWLLSYHSSQLCIGIFLGILNFTNGFTDFFVSMGILFSCLYGILHKITVQPTKV